MSKLVKSNLPTVEVATLLNAFDLKQFRPMAHARALAIYGSLLFKPLTEVRDIDMFAIMKDEGAPTGRIEVTVPVTRAIRKRASIYLINERDYLRDAIHGIYGGRWPVLGYHGYVCASPQYDDYHAWGIAGLSHHLNLSLEVSPVDFFQTSATKICSIYPMYAKSVVDYINNSQMRKIAEDTYGRTRSRAFSRLIDLKRMTDRLSTRELKKRYLNAELSARPVDGGTGIRPLRDKLARTLSVICEHSNALASYCSRNGFATMIESYQEAADILDELEKETPKSTEVVCPLIGRYELDLTWTKAIPTENEEFIL